MGVSRGLTGTPWHIEKMTREEGDPRRHRARCRFFRKKDSYCTLHKRKCSGSAHCSRYKEGTTVMAPEESVNPIIKHQTKEKPLETDYREKAKEILPIGSLVCHNRFGEGKIVRYEEENIVIEFDDVGIKILSIKQNINQLKKTDRFTLRQSLANKQHKGQQNEN